MSKNSITLISTDALIASIQLLRNSRIHTLLQDETELANFLDKHCDVIAISPVRREFLKRDLLELKESRLNLIHYAPVLNESKVSGTISEAKMHELFVLEFQLLFDKYKF